MPSLRIYCTAGTRNSLLIVVESPTHVANFHPKNKPKTLQNTETAIPKMPAVPGGRPIGGRPGGKPLMFGGVVLVLQASRA